MRPQHPADHWYYAQNKTRMGPLSSAELRRLLAEGALKPTDMVWQEGTQKWQPLADVANGESDVPPKIRQPALDRWYYAQNKKKVGPVSLTRLGRLLAEGVLTLEDMVFQEGTIRWRPLAAVAGLEIRSARTGRGRRVALIGSVGLGFLVLLAWGLVAVGHGPDGNRDEENPEAAAEVTSSLSQTEGTSKEVEPESLQIGSKAPQRPKDSERKDSDPGDDTPSSPKERATLALQLGHTDTIRSVAFSSDGKQVLTGSDDRSARLWDMASGMEIRAFRAHTDKVRSVAFSPNGKQVLTGSDDKTARLWDVAGGTEIRAFKAHTDKVWSVAFSPDGKQVLTGSLDQTARLWNAATGAEIGVFIGQPLSRPPILSTSAAITSVAFSPDGKQVVTGSTDMVAKSWDVDSRKLVKVFLGHGSDVYSVAVSRDGRQLLTGSADRTMRLWDMAAAGSPTSVGIYANHTTRSQDMVAGREIQAFRMFQGNVTAVAFSPDGKQLLSGNVDRSVVLWDASTGRKIRAFPGSGQKIASVAFSPDGTKVLAGGDAGMAVLWDADSGRKIRTFQGGHSDKPQCVAFSPDGKQLLTGNGKGELSARLWDLAGGKLIRTFRVEDMKYPPAVYSVAFSPDGKQVLMGNSDNTARLWNAANGKQIGSFSWQQKFILGVHYPKTSAAFSPDGKQILAGSSDNTMRLWDAATGTEICAFEGNKEIKAGAGIASAAFSPDGKQVITGGADTRQTRYMNQYQKNVIVGTLDRTARLWDAVSGKEIRTFRGHTGGLNCVVFSPDGKQVLTGSDDRSARLWDTASGKEIRALQAHIGKVASVAFSPDGKQMLTGTADYWGGTAFSSAQLMMHPSGGMSPTRLYGPKWGDQANLLRVEDQRGDYTIRSWDAATGRELRAFRGHTGGITSVVFSPDGKQIASASEDHTTRLWDAASGRELCRFISFSNNSWVVVTPDNYYMASRGSLEGVAFRVGDRVYPFDQFDLKFNRPDKVIGRIGLAPEDTIAAYRHAYQRRLKRMNFTQEMLNNDFHIPEIVVKAGEEFATGEKTLKMKIQANDTKYLLDRIYVDVNGVPLFGTAGIGLRKQSSKAWQQEIEIELSAGKNKIDVSVLNEKGAESLKETLFIQCNAPARKPALYVVAVGISDYQDTHYRLNYADKDARDLADLFESKRDRFDNVKVLRILNRDATRENILKVRDFLKPSRVEDVVVLFFAGHGLLDSKLGYYFATADIDFRDPAKRGLAYESIEELLDGIGARKKLLLMDTCHSGELDKEDIQVVQSEKQPEGEVKTRAFRGRLTRVAPKVGLNNSYQLLQEMFADLRRGTGAVVIASAGGAEYALESATWKNGVFTYALLRGLKGEADRNRDHRVQVSELRDFVEQEVRLLTNGRQAPTSRRENIELDFTLD